MGFRENPENINRNGRPKKGNTLTDILSKQLELKKKDGKTQKTQKELIVKALIELALSNTVMCPYCQKHFPYGGDLGALKYIFDRKDGRPVEHIEAQGDINYYCIPPKSKKSKKDE